ncbi:glycosyltransferase [Amycolatopsis sp. NPDC052450]|uniref:glycosyltransferase n=1 Tax=Amycolatopsis sp. NPDC052450 TaxID=3363937 RepID=UPI0037C9C770
MRVSAEVGTWLARRSSRAGDWWAGELVVAKRGTRVSVVIPARDEAETVGAIVGTIRRELVERFPLVDEILVVDSHSTDATAEVARAAGADVVAQDAVFPALEGLPGKGEALWKGVAETTGDLVVFVDGDLRDFTAGYVTGLLGPLLTDPGIAYVKGFYHRPLAGAAGVEPDGGGRVISAAPPSTSLAQFRRGVGEGVERELVLTDVALTQRPPLESLPPEIRPENSPALRRSA